MQKPEISFPAPVPGFGEVRAAAIQNPRWRWWRPWEPRVLWIEFQVPYKVLSPGDTLSFPDARGLKISEY